MPLFESPPNESDGGYAVSDFRKIDARFGNLEDLNICSGRDASKKYVPDAGYRIESYIPSA